MKLYFGEIASSKATLAEAIALAKQLNDTHGLALALCWAAIFGHLERNPAEVERFASELIELSTRQNFPYWIVLGSIFRGWALSERKKKKKKEIFFTVGRSVLLAIQLRASRGSRTEYETIGPTQLWGCHTILC